MYLFDRSNWWKMQVSTHAVKGNLCLGLQNLRPLPSSRELRENNLGFAVSELRMTKRSSCFGIGLDSIAMGARGNWPRSVYGSLAKARSVRAQAYGSCF